jgi:hypothetical protein
MRKSHDPVRKRKTVNSSSRKSTAAKSTTRTSGTGLWTTMNSATKITFNSPP